MEVELASTLITPGLTCVMDVQLNLLSKVLQPVIGKFLLPVLVTVGIAGLTFASSTSRSVFVTTPNTTTTMFGARRIWMHMAVGLLQTSTVGSGNRMDLLSTATTTGPPIVTAAGPGARLTDGPG